VVIMEVVVAAKEKEMEGWVHVILLPITEV